MDEDKRFLIMSLSYGVWENFLIMLWIILKDDMIKESFYLFEWFKEWKPPKNEKTVESQNLKTFFLLKIYSIDLYSINHVELNYYCKAEYIGDGT